ncbi:type III secretion system chaperone [Acidovorax sp. Be4]|uniref:Type III secretion system chaperone n=1 Tax=Acidovorax bellezanensis TaxID=2976702 RepID=A0ABT2PPH9_9BURK|nr:type III secretion system chaperone [Acidovorax sp. Be4]MCT9812366.1 type III secretion system chaperone [Acidovorax sp. Be4]
MTSDEQYRAALAALALEIGVDAQALAVREELVIDGIPVGLSRVQRAGGDAIQGACKIGLLPRQPSVALLRLLLQANTQGRATGGATLGLQHAADELVLASVHPLDTPPAALARGCRTLVEVAAVWAAAVHQPLPVAATAAA